jgi:hypothetical protein
MTPHYPSRSPSVTRNPYPTVVVRVGPTAIVEGSPTPRVIGNPGIAIFCHSPITIGVVRTEILIYIRHPYIAILRVIDPFSIW